MTSKSETEVCGALPHSFSPSLLSLLSLFQSLVSSSDSVSSVASSCCCSSKHAYITSRKTKQIVYPTFVRQFTLLISSFRPASSITTHTQIVPIMRREGLIDEMTYLAVFREVDFEWLHIFVESQVIQCLYDVISSDCLLIMLLAHLTCPFGPKRVSTSPKNASQKSQSLFASSSAFLLSPSIRTLLLQT